MRITMKNDALEAWLGRENMTVSDFARQLKMKRQYLWMIRTQKRNPGPRTRQRLQDETGLTFDELFRIEA